MGLRIPLPSSLRGRGPGRTKGAKGVRRPRVVPRVVGCLLALAVLCVIPVFVNTAIGYVPVLTFVFVLALSALYPRILARRLEFALLVDRETCLRNTDVRLLVRFSNPVRLICPRVDAEVCVTDIFGEEDTSSSFSFSLGAKRMRDFELGVRFAHVGTVTAGVRRLVVHDPLGLFFCTVAVGDRREIEVLPHVFPVDASLARTLRLQEALESATPFSRDGMDYTGVREYAYGDPLKSIHWKLLSHSDELYTRLFDSVGEPMIDILCGTEFGDHDNQTLMSLYDVELEAALSVYEFCLANQLRTRLSFCDGQDSQATFDSASRPSHRAIVRAFPSLTAGPPEGLAELVLQRASGTAGENNLVVCTATLSEALVDALVQASRGCGGVILFYVMPPGIDSVERRELVRPLRRLEQSSVSCFALDSAEQLGEIAYE